MDRYLNFLRKKYEIKKSLYVKLAIGDTYKPNQR